jgi:dihydropteroate synthase
VTKLVIGLLADSTAVSWTLRSRRPLPFGVSANGAWEYRWDRCAVMGIVNVTSDSFSDGGLYASTDAAIAHARALVVAGAAVVDVGGESTRPGSAGVDLIDELSRVIPVIEALAADGNVLVSVDTCKPAVAQAAIAAGAHLVNDISGLSDREMIEVCALTGTPVVIMHMQGTPATMQRDPHYADVVAEVRDFLESQARMAISAGIPSMMIDPGIGFGKTLDHNLALLRAEPISTEFPVLIGASRKKMIGTIAGIADPALRDSAGMAVHLDAARRGVAMLRVHDVAGNVGALAVQAAIDTS